MITPLAQIDSRWSSVKIGNSNASLGRYGCTITSLCMLLEKLRGYAGSPPDAARHWKFNRKAEILWNSTNFKGMKYITRGYYPDYDKIREYVEATDRGAIMEVNHGKHWVYVEKIDGKKISIIDPIDGKRYSELPSKYKFTGYALFEAVALGVPEWLQPLWKKAKDKGLGANDPAMKMNLADVLDALFEMKLIDKPKDQIMVGEFIAALDKIKERW